MFFRTSRRAAYSTTSADWYIRAARIHPGHTHRRRFRFHQLHIQGEQVGILWNELFSQYHLKIHFAHRTFKWASEARGKASVHVVIVGFAAFDTANKRIYDYEAGGEKITVSMRQEYQPVPRLTVPTGLSATGRIRCAMFLRCAGATSQPMEGTFCCRQKSEDELLKTEPAAKKFIRPYMGGSDFINGTRRYCLWLAEADSAQVRKLPGLMRRVEARSRASGQRVKQNRPANMQSIPPCSDEIRPTRFGLSGDSGSLVRESPLYTDRVRISGSDLQ